MTTVLLWQIRQSSKKVSFAIFMTVRKRAKKERKPAAVLLENAVWATCAFEQPKMQ